MLNLLKKLRTKKDTNLGKDGEDKAVKFLTKNGFKIVGRNFHSRFGEIDIIVEDDNTLRFIEVKASLRYDALERITPDKMSKIIKTAEYYISKHDIQKDYQIDAIIINDNKIEWIKNIIC